MQGEMVANGVHAHNISWRWGAVAVGGATSQLLVASAEDRGRIDSVNKVWCDGTPHKLACGFNYLDS